MNHFADVFNCLEVLVMALTAEHDHDHPWNLSALIIAFSRLMLSVLVLLQTVFACLSLQLIQRFGLELPWWYHHYLICTRHLEQFRHDYQRHPVFRCEKLSWAPAPGVGYASVSDVYNDGASPERKVESSQTPPLLSEGLRSEEEDHWAAFVDVKRRLKRWKSQGCFAVDRVTIVCSKCNTVWSNGQLPSLTDATGEKHWEDGLNEEGGSVFRHFNVKEGCLSQERNDMGIALACGAQRKNKEMINHDPLKEISHEAEEAIVNTNLSSVHESQWLQIENQEDETLSGRLGEVRPNDALQLFDKQRSEGLLAPGSDEQSIERKVSLANSPYRGELIRNSVIGTPGFTQLDLAEETQQMVGLTIITEGDLGSEDVILGLRESLLTEEKTLCALYAELEEERNASATAANEAMAMISRLQEEKAALQMEAAHYQRMAEEKAIYDEQATQLLKEILYRKERENFLLEKEVKLFKTKFLREVNKARQTGRGIENPLLPVEGSERTFMLKGNDRASVLKEQLEMGLAESGFKGKCPIGNGEISTESFYHLQHGL